VLGRSLSANKGEGKFGSSNRTAGALRDLFGVNCGSMPNLVKTYVGRATLNPILMITLWATAFELPR